MISDAEDPQVVCQVSCDTMVALLMLIKDAKPYVDEKTTLDAFLYILTDVMSYCNVDRKTFLEGINEMWDAKQ